MYYIGIDIGTTSVKLLAIDENGNVVRTASREYPIFFPRPLWSEQNPEDWWTQAMDGLAELLEGLDRKKVEAVSFSGQMHGLVVLDEQDRVIRPAILWNDQRTEKQCRYLNEAIGRDKLSQWTGNVALTGFTAPKLLWLRENEPSNFARISKIMLPKDYVAYRLSGAFATDMSDASGTLYLDVQHRTWSEPMLAILGIKESQLPQLHEAYEPVGFVSRELAEQLGLNPEVRVIIGGGDQAVAAVGGGVTGAGACSVSLGTSGVVFAATEKYFSDGRNSLHSFCHANGKYHLMGVTLAAAASLKWWVEEVNRSEDFDGLLEEAGEAPVEDSVFYLPYLMGERTPHNDPYCRGTFIGMDMTHSRKHMTRAVLEGVAFSLRDTFEIMKAMGISIPVVSISGGGSKSSLWCRIIADVLDVQVVKLNTNEGPAYGAAILAAVGSGLFDSVEAACQAFIQVSESIRPDRKSVELYNRKYGKFKEVYPAVKELFRKLTES